MSDMKTGNGPPGIGWAVLVLILAGVIWYAAGTDSPTGFSP